MGKLQCEQCGLENCPAISGKRKKLYKKDLKNLNKSLEKWYNAYHAPSYSTTSATTYWSYPAYYTDATATTTGNACLNYEPKYNISYTGYTTTGTGWSYNGK